MKYITKTDKQIAKLVALEEKRQSETLTMIPSENYSSTAVREALGSVFTNKYFEGEPRKRYYQGNANIDEVELLAIERILKLLKLSQKNWHANVKAVSAGIANFCVLTALLETPSENKHGGKIMSMFLPDGGHLSHGWKIGDKAIHVSAKLFDVVQYKVEEKTSVFDYNKIAELAEKEKPNIIISGGTAYPREINYKKLSEIAHKVGAYYMADIAHEAGLIVGKAMRSPFPYADIVTMSTQKTLRGPRGSIIICKKELSEKIDRAIFPGLQGGPFGNNIAAIAVALKEAESPKFKNYATQTIKNARALAEELKKYNFNIVSGGTDKHLVLVDLRNKNKNGKEVAIELEAAGIVANKNTVPQETASPFTPSGIRFGTPALTTRGMKEKEMKQIAKWIHDVVDKKEDPKKISAEVKKLCKKFPVPKNI